MSQQTTQRRLSLMALVALNVGTTLTSCAGLTGAPHNSPSLSSAGNETAASPFTTRLNDGTLLRIASLSDCEQFSDAWPRGLCGDIESFSASRMPSTGEDLQTLSRTGDVEQTMDAAYAWFMLRDDTSFCGYQSVQIWVSAGMQTKDGEQARLAAMANVRKQGVMGITNPSRDEDPEVLFDTVPPSSPQAS